MMNVEQFLTSLGFALVRHLEGSAIPRSLWRRKHIKVYATPWSCMAATCYRRVDLPTVAGDHRFPIEDCVNIYEEIEAEDAPILKRILEFQLPS